MKTTMFKVMFIFLMSFTLVQSSEAAGRYFYHAPRVVCAPVYCGPRFVGTCYGRVLVPGHYFINRFGVREYARPYYR